MLVGWHHRVAAACVAWADVLVEASGTRLLAIREPAGIYIKLGGKGGGYWKRDAHSIELPCRGGRMRGHRITQEWNATLAIPHGCGNATTLGVIQGWNATLATPHVAAGMHHYSPTVGVFKVVQRLHVQRQECNTATPARWRRSPVRRPGHQSNATHSLSGAEAAAARCETGGRRALLQWCVSPGSAGAGMWPH